MWDKIKKAINSNIAKPLDILLGELYNSHRTDIVNTYNKSNEANINAWQSLQKGQEIVNIMNDTGGKRYTVTRSFHLFRNNESFYYSGSSGIIRSIDLYGGERIKIPDIYIDGIKIEYNPNLKNFELEFKNTISIRVTNWGDTSWNAKVRGIIQTEK